MPEINPAASFLIATSWQALKRAETGNQSLMMTNCTVIVLFAGFFIEASLNHILNTMGKTEEPSGFGGGRNPGLGTKLAWFYGSYISPQDLSDKDRVYEAMWKEFPEAEEIIEFRNSIAHGEIERQLTNLEDAKRLRAAAKQLVSRLLSAAQGAGFTIERGVTYKMAIRPSKLPDGEPEQTSRMNRSGT